MEFLLELHQKKSYGQIPITGPNGKIQYFIRGNLDNPNHTLYLVDLNNDEMGRLFTDYSKFIASFTVDIINEPIAKVKKINNPLANLFFVTHLNYLITGSIKKGTYTFRAGAKNVASVKTIMGDNGVVLVCNISKFEDIPYILLITVLLTQWHVTPLKLPIFPPINPKLST
ncbi:hypothetical protein [Lactobacillus agrestimuris]|uniref:hypothetical protein n=1 Tax=Lactobacillus agrestimuris TaxID=2941328 RepID=UPI0019CBFC1A|nr:hypothetical protein [Lactobacillus agrestimuris]MBD5431438.1 hypothetical protein [Lactobacillus sp.]